MDRKKRSLSGILCAIIVAALLVSAVFIAAELHHDCAGEHCPICSAISSWEHLLRVMALLAALGGALALTDHSSGAPMSARFGRAALPTLVTLKVKLSD